MKQQPQTVRGMLEQTLQEADALLQDANGSANPDTKSATAHTSSDAANAQANPADQADTANATQTYTTMADDEASFLIHFLDKESNKLLPSRQYVGKCGSDFFIIFPEIEGYVRDGQTSVSCQYSNKPGECIEWFIRYDVCYDDEDDSFLTRFQNAIGNIFNTDDGTWMLGLVAVLVLCCCVAPRWSLFSWLWHSHSEPTTVTEEIDPTGVAGVGGAAIDDGRTGTIIVNGNGNTVITDGNSNVSVEGDNNIIRPDDGTSVKDPTYDPGMKTPTTDTTPVRPDNGVGTKDPDLTTGIPDKDPNIGWSTPMGGQTEGSQGGPNQPSEPTAQYSITVRYVDVEGKALMPPTIQMFSVGEKFQMMSPSIYGYTANQASISGTMGSTDRSYTVTYSPNPTHP